MIEGWFRAKDGTSLYYKVEGEGIPIVLSDGIGCDGYAWAHFLPFFRDRFKIVHWHYRGHGRSEMPHDMEYVSIPDICEDMNCLFEELKLEPAIIVGHSMGVQVVLEFWHMFPEKVRAIIPVHGSYGHPLDTFHDNRILATLFPYLKKFAIEHKAAAQKFWEAIVPTKLAMLVATTFEVNGRLINEDEFWPYFEHIGYVDVELFVRMLEKAQNHDAQHFLKDINVPVLIIGGEKDTFTPGWLARKMARMIPGAQLMMIPTGSHTGMMEIPELFLLRVEKFLEKKVLSASAPVKPPVKTAVSEAAEPVKAVIPTDKPAEKKKPSTAKKPAAAPRKAAAVAPAPAPAKTPAPAEAKKTAAKKAAPTAKKPASTAKKAPAESKAVAAEKTAQKKTAAKKTAAKKAAK